MFEPTAIAGGPSGLSDWPRPFVFRATHLDGCTIPAGASFYFDLNLFDMSRPAIAHLVEAFAELGREGLGPGRGRAELVDVAHRGQALQDNPEPLVLPLDPQGERVGRVLVRFLTPTELKSGQQNAVRPEFGILLSRIRDRLSTLRELYDDGPLAIDFRGFAERAARVRMTRCDLAQVEVARRSSRTAQVHSIGGFVGEAEYEGDLAEFIPYLHVARWTGVGRQTVWGKGEIQVQISS
jgi:CRISPR-associated endoribonuclease Cas6